MELPLSLVGIFGSGCPEGKIWEVIGSADESWLLFIRGAKEGLRLSFAP